MDIITLFVNMFRGIYIIVCISYIGEKFNTNKFKYLFISVLFFTITTLITYTFPLYPNSKFEPYLVISLAILLYFLRFKKTLYSSSFHFLFGYLVTAIFQLIILLIYTLLNITMSDMIEKPILVLYMEAAMLLLVLAFAHFDIFRKLSTKIDNFSPYIITIVLNLFVYLQIVRITTDWLTNQKDVNFVYTYLLFFILLVVNSIMMRYVIKSQREKSELQTYKDYEKMIIPLIENSRAAEHDFKNHLLTLNAMTKNPTEEFKEYIQNIKHEIDVDSVYKLSNNPVVGALLQEKANHANENNILLKIEISDKANFPEGLKPHHLITILSNLIDNAFEEVSKHTCDNKEVIFKLTQQDEIKISVKNYLAKDTKNNLNEMQHTNTFSTKGKSRGYGMKNIKKIIKKYNGKLEIYHLQNEIDIKVTIIP